MRVRIDNVERVQRHLTDSNLWTVPLQALLRTAGKEAQQVASQGQPQSVARSLSYEVHGLQATVTSTLPVAVEVGRRPGAPLPPLGAMPCRDAQAAIAPNGGSGAPGRRPTSTATGSVLVTVAWSPWTS